MPSASPNIAAVARAAGVSPSSVSNAYNRPDQLSAAVRERILATARELGYAGPDPAARSLRSRRAMAIGMLFSSGLPYAFTDPYCVELLRGVSEVAEEFGTSVVLMPVAPHRAPAGSEAAQVTERTTRQALVDGVIADCLADGHPALAVLKARGLPLVRTVDDPDALCVLVDDHDGGRRIGAHLAALGHRDVVVLVDGPADAPLPHARARLDGLREGLGAEVRVVGAARNTADAGREAARVILAGDAPPTAIAAVSDVLALGALEPARARGISVTGFDDVPEAAAAGLTTVRQPTLDKGRTMGRMLLDPAFGERRVVLPIELRERASTGRPA